MAERIEIRVPDIGEFTDVPVIEVLVAAGDRVEADQSLVTLESDKATMEVPSPAAGVIAELRVALNDTVSEGDVVAVLEVAGEDSPEAAPDADAGATEAETGPESESEPEADAESEAGTGPAEAEDATDAGQAGPPAADQAGAPARSGAETRAPGAGERRSPPVAAGPEALPDRVPYASPAVRRFARELGVDLFRVRGSGRKGRILRDDVAAFVKSVMVGDRAGPAAPGLDIAPPPKVDFSAFGEVESRPLSRIKKLTARNLHRNWVTIPHVTHHDRADITELEAFRQEHKQAAKEQGFNLTPLAFLIPACVAALKAFPQFNASLNEGGDALILKQYFHIGIAVDTEDGLVVPVIRDCDQKGLLEIARELAEVSQRARDKKLKPADWQGGCFSISSLGSIGGTAFTPIINLPEVAILGVSRSVQEPVWDGEGFRPRLMLPLSLSYDHRVIDGAEAARFARFLAEYLEDSGNLEL